MMKVFLLLFPIIASVTQTQGYDYYMFSQQWPGSFCHVHDYCLRYVTEKRDLWSIHGLWPSTANSNRLKFCKSNEPFRISKVQNMKNELKVYWPSYSSSNEKFWKHEWDKHGRCSNMTEQEYFKKTLQLKKEYKITKALKKSGIIPTNRRKYKVSDIQKALDKAYKARVQLICVKSDKTKEFYLAEARFCLDLKFRLIHCKKRSSCRKDGYVRYSSGNRLISYLSGNIHIVFLSSIYLIITQWLF
ncbi:ribonuclease DdI-like isoform X1 [Argonauta hians]